MENLDRQKEEALAAVAAAQTLDELEAQRVAALGKQGWDSQLLKTLGKMTPEERQSEGPKIHALREAVQGAITDRKSALEQAALDARLATETLDLTLPAPDALQGSVHPIGQVMDELAEVFADLGFAVANGPEIEDDWHNFTALNMPESHPARAMHDTFYFPQELASSSEAAGQNNPASSSEAVGQNTQASSSDAVGQNKRMLLRTHTSPVQIRAMMAQGAPLRIIAPGRVYRSDSDATHTPMFHQVEGLVIDKGIHLGHLKWTLETFLKAFFERDDIVLRLRPSYFPFTEPSVEVDVGFAIEKGPDGKDRRVLGGSGDAPGHGWMELLGSGMVNRRVLEFSGLDPDAWQGFAFGVGVDRLAMLKYGMDDLRAFFDGDVRWLRHYGFSAFDQPTLSAGVGARA
ncbi:MAG: phenylalanine--tRNA ligase subunit alpha [Novosphingobium sp.]